MGCVNSRTDINDLHPNLFQVMNVDDLGNLITPGRLEVTETDIVLYQRGKQPIKWPLRCLRRYGYDAEIFSFESGRRCSTGPGIYAFKCRRAAHLFNLVQTNIQVCNQSGGGGGGHDDTISRELPLATSAHSGSGPGSGPDPETVATTRVTIPVEPNYLDPILSSRNTTNNRTGSKFAHTNNQQRQPNGVGRLDSIVGNGGGSSSTVGGGLLVSPSSQENCTSSPMLSSSPVLLLLQTPPPPSPFPQPPPYPSSLYVNEEVLLSSFVPCVEMEHNNNKSLRRAIQRSCTVSNSISSSGTTATAARSLEQQPSVHKNSEVSSTSCSREQTKSSHSTVAAYMNVDINNDDISLPLSPTHHSRLPEAVEVVTQFKKEKNVNDECGHAYMNISPGHEKETECFTNGSGGRQRPSPLPCIMQLSAVAGEAVQEEGIRHCYANLEASEIESLRKRFSGIVSVAAAAEKSPLPPSTPTGGIGGGGGGGGGPIREVNYAVLDLDTKDVPTTTISPLDGSSLSFTTASSPPESPNKLQQQQQKLGYATIDFNKTAALSHSVNPNHCVVNDNEGSRKTRHNSTISDLAAASTAGRRSSSVSE